MMMNETQNENRQLPVATVPRLALRPKDAAKALGIGERLLWTKTNCGEIPHLRVGGAILYPVAVLEEWLAEEVKKSMRRSRR